VTSDAPTNASEAAVFFDVDGTLIRSTIVHYYVYFRRRRMSSIRWKIWYAAFLLKCVYFLVLDKIDRSRFNVVFYRSYRSLSPDRVKALARECYDAVIRPRQYQEVEACIAEHRKASRRIVLVTGSIDFIIKPLAEDLRADDVIASSLVEVDGRFTGELDGPPIGQEEKGRRVLEFARTNAIDLSRSYAYGDAIADLPMLEAVGLPHAVNPDKALGAVAKARGWPVHHWSLPVVRA